MDTAATHILQVEDNPKDIQLVAEALAKASDVQFALESASALAEALARISEGGVDVVLLDLLLPDSRGLETFTRVHAQNPGVPIVVLTASNDETLALQAVHAGAHDYLIKGEIQLFPKLLWRALRYAIERQQAATALARLAAFSEQNPEPIIELDGLGRVLYVNPAAQAQFSWLSANGAGHPMLGGLDVVRASLEREGRTFLTREVELGDRVFEQHISTAPASDLLRLYVTDITQRKHAETRLKQAHDTLRATQLQLIQAEKLESVGRLAAGVAHEVKNPLAIILEGIHYLSQHLVPEDPKISTVLCDITKAIQRADAVIRGLLDFSAPTSLVTRPEDVNTTVEQALALVKHELERSHTSVVKDFAAHLPPVRLDRQKIIQVFVNLFMNSLEAMRPQGGTLRVTTSAKLLTELGHRIGVRNTDWFRIGELAVAVEVEDTGPGIPPEQLVKVCDPFFTTKPIGQGTGLGLTVARTIVDLHGGLFDISNRPASGVKVTILLKAVARQDAPSGLPSAACEPTA